MIGSQAKQFSLSGDGRIFWQKDPTNPTPGVAVARISKGESALVPAIELFEEEAAVKDMDKDAALAELRKWLDAHVAEVLAPLVSLQNHEGLNEHCITLAGSLFDAMGVIPRSHVEDVLGQIDAEARKALRAKNVRFGPVLIFQPSLNKPAAVRLRALLWSLYHGRSVPAPVPADGVVSVALPAEDIEGKKIDYLFYRAIGYPVYGPRAIRIDMLDRVIGAVYDSAKDGKFHATHQMAEWLGCSIADLYAILEAMGHRKIHDPADEVKPEEVGEKAEAAKVELAAEPEVAQASISVEPAVQPEEVPKGGGAPVQPQAKPELATFVLRKGKESGGKTHAGKKPHTGFKGKKDGDSKSRPNKPHKHKKGPPKKDFGPRVLSAPAKPLDPSDSPFAVLEQLKAKK